MQPLGVGVEQSRRQTNKPAIKATTKLNPQTGIVSNAWTRFSAENWGKETAHYLRSIEKMRDGSLEEIVVLAEPLMSLLKKSHQESLTGGYPELSNFCACLVDEWYGYFHSCSTLPIADVSIDIAFSQLRADREWQDYFLMEFWV